ncbi:NADH dehydrogenase 1 beta like protein [Argiope bruennichi]|uniref:NADH dehydrogenase [ubiquinone] 1 beta subcomplex subunit 11, mitochondrial n=1 Tax=Argiope bruennichi TaxID=94029 RepID=A0A8T0EAM4_ARGBR|nr:NADH dehydrogenase 1 beta like protein [Argiope bruennichi]
MSLSRISRSYPAIFNQLQRYSITKVALISTSKKSKDTLAFPDDVFPKKLPPAPKTVEDFAETKNPKFWVSYGYDEENYETDRHDHKVINFFMLTVLVCGGTFIMAYNPDVQNKDWIYREAYLRMNSRQKQGLPIIDKNYIDPEKIELPSDEELGDTEIII